MKIHYQSQLYHQSEVGIQISGVWCDGLINPASTQPSKWNLERNPSITLASMLDPNIQNQLSEPEALATIAKDI